MKAWHCPYCEARNIEYDDDTSIALCGGCGQEFIGTMHGIDNPQTDTAWLLYADEYWPEIQNHCGLDTSFVGKYSDDAAISYAKAYYAQN